MSELVKVTFLDNGVAIISLNRPEKLNALSKELVLALKDNFEQISKLATSHKIRAVLIKSESEKAFCAGADLQERSEMNDVQVRETLQRQHAMMSALEKIPVPTFALMNGVAFGGGLELALCCDFRLATPQAQMGLVEGRLAIIPGAGGTQRLPRLIGESRAKELIFRAKKITAQEAKVIGLINEISENPEALALSWVEDILLCGPIAIQTAKKAIVGGAEKATLEAAIAHEMQCYENVLTSEDRKEGMKSFFEKRKPSYKGI